MQRLTGIVCLIQVFIKTTSKKAFQDINDIIMKHIEDTTKARQARCLQGRHRSHI